MDIAVAAAGGPSWTDIMTAFGTVGAVVVALGIALWSERRSDRRVREERGRSDRLLAAQREREKAAVDDERAHGRAQLEEERRLALEREQFAEASAVQVVPGEDTVGEPDAQGDLDGSVKQLAVMIVNRGSYTITGVEAQFCLGGNQMISHHRYVREPGFGGLPRLLVAQFGPSPERAVRGVLAPWDTGIRFETDAIHERHLASWYPVVRWTDRWGVWWEYKRGAVRPIRGDEPWVP